MSKSFLSLFGMLSMLVASPVFASFVHPGINATQEELDRMKAVINGPGSHPMKTGYQALLKFKPRTAPSPFAVWDRRSQWNTIILDWTSIYYYALQWVVTGKQEHAEKAKQFLNAWGRTLKSVNRFKDHNYAGQYKLNSGHSTSYLLAGAEIIRYYSNNGKKAGWSDSDITVFENMTKNALWPVFRWNNPCPGWRSPGCAYTDSPEMKSLDMGRVSNHETSGALARLSIAVFNNDDDKYNTAKNFYVKLLQRYIYPSGQLGETCRDATHDAMGLIGLLLSAEVMWIQGEDVYAKKFGSDTRPRLLVGLEYKCRQVFESVPKICNGKKSGATGMPMKLPGWEVALNHYKNRVKMDVPWATKYIEGKVRPDVQQRMFPSWSTATHADRDINHPVPITDAIAVNAANVSNMPGMLSINSSPLNAHKHITYTVPANAHVTLKAYDLFGRELVAMVDEFRSAGAYSITWLDNEEIANGTHIYTLFSGRHILARKLNVHRLPMR